MLKVFKLPLLLIAIIVLALFFGHLIPHSGKAFMYAISLTIKEILVFVLPFIIFSLIFSSISNLQSSKVILMVILLVVAICLSNVISSLTAYFAGSKILALNLNTIKFQNSLATHTLHPTWTLTLPVIIKNSHALLLGLVTSIVLGEFMGKKTKKIAQSLSKISMFILKRLFIPIIPIFILGFALKMQDEQIISALFHNYLIILVIVFFLAYTYILFLYGIGSGFKIKQWISSVSNMLPAALVAMSAMSSLAAMPVTLAASEKNTDKDTSLLVIPISVNIHLIGDSFFVITSALAILSSFNGVDVSLHDQFIFLVYFTLSKFAVAAVPGGGVIVMLPIFEQYLHFSPTMLSIITTLYMVFDPIIASANVMGNGAFTIIFSKLYKKVFPKQSTIR